MLSSVFASSAVALVGLLVAAPAHVDALVTPPGSGAPLGHVAARHFAGVSPNHNALARRKRNVHKNRKRCQQRPPSSTPAPQPSSGGNDYSTPPPATTTPAPYVPPVNTGAGKLLLAWPNNDDPAIPASYYFTGKASRYYTWSPFKLNNAPGNVGFCAMLWGYNQVYDFDQKVVAGYTDCVLAMNEPNEPSQSNMSPDQGADLWNNHIAHLATQGYNILGSPATTSAPSGLQWIQSWLPMVNVKPTVICVHWYDVSFENFQQYVTNFYNGAGQRPIWVTEFACQNFNGGAQCSMDQIWAFVTQAAQWMDSQDWVQMYAPFGFMQQMQGVNDLDRLINWDGTPTDLGKWFIYSS
jgi:hypothetical protein